VAPISGLLDSARCDGLGRDHGLAGWPPFGEKTVMIRHTFPCAACRGERGACVASGIAKRDVLGLRGGGQEKGTSRHVALRAYSSAGCGCLALDGDQHERDQACVCANRFAILVRRASGRRVRLSAKQDTVEVDRLRARRTRPPGPGRVTDDLSHGCLPLECLANLLEARRLAGSDKEDRCGLPHSSVANSGR